MPDLPTATDQAPTQGSGALPGAGPSGASQPADARAQRTWLGVATLGTAAGLAIALASGSPAHVARAAGPAGGNRSAGDGAPCQGAAELKISSRHPVQRRAVSFDAAASRVGNGSVVFYDFRYGDGTDDATTQATAVHAFQETGTYLVRLNLVTSCNTVVSSPAYHVVVRDGLPPTVGIIYPRSDETTSDDSGSS